MERVDDVETVYVGHQEVEHDQVREIALRHLDCITAAVRARHRARHTLDVERDQLHRPGVVVDDQNAQGFARLDGYEAELSQGIVQLLARDRLLHHRRGAKRESLVAIRDYGDDDDRHLFERRHVLETAEQLPTIHLREHDVERYQRQLILLRQHQRGFGRHGVNDLEAFRLEVYANELGGFQVVFDDHRDAITSIQFHLRFDDDILGATDL